MLDFSDRTRTGISKLISRCALKHLFKAHEIQHSFEQLTEICKEKVLKIYDKKTQLLTISNSKNDNVAWLKLKDGTTMYSSDQLKLLGFIFSTKPNINAQIDNIVQRAAGRSFVLRHLASIHCNKEKLRNVYCSIIQSILRV